MAEIISTILTIEELSQIPLSIKDKVEKELALKTSSVDSAQAEVERVKADYEQKCYEIDKKIIEMSSRLDTESSGCLKATARCQELEEEIKTSREMSNALESSFAECQGEMAALRHTHDLWKDEKLSMQHLIEKRDLEINGLKAEWKALSDKLANMTVSKNEAELKLDELQNSGVTVQYHNKRLEREKELLAEQNQQLSAELNAKSAELNSVKMGKENELLSLKGRLEVKMDECRQFGLTAENLRTTNEELEKKITDLLEKASSAEEDRRSMEELYRNELESQVKLAELYQASAKDEQAKSEELASAVQELQKLVTETAGAIKSAEVKLKESESRNLELLTNIEMLKKELEKANDLLTTSKGRGNTQLTKDDLAALSPAAAMASKFMKSGMTLTEMYTKYTEAVDEVDVAKQESKRLNEAMDAILEELNEKAPVLKQQREDYERALATITQLTSQMDAAAIECQRLRAEADDASRKLARVERENKRMQMETKDLSTQVKYLVKELEESRGNQVSMDVSRASNDDADVTSSSEIISGQLVTFKNIEELQRQNVKLLRIVRELSDESEKKERENQSDEMKQLKETLDRANEELDSLRSDRDRQIEFVEAIVRQRDMYRVLLAQESNAGFPASVLSSPRVLSCGDGKDAGDGPSKRRSVNESSEVTSKALQALKNEYDEYKKEVQANNKVMNEQTDNLRRQITELNADNAKLQAKTHFSAEKYDVMKQSFDNSRKESELHREKNTKLMMLVQKHEMSLSSTANELTRAQQEKTKIFAQLETARSEIEILRRAEDRLRAENSSLQRDQRGQSVLLTNLQKIQQTMEKQEFEVRSELRGRLEVQEQELKSLRRNNQDAVQQIQEVLQMTEKQLLSTKQNLEKQQNMNSTLSAELRNLKSELETTKTEKQNSESKLSTLEQRLARLATQKGTTIANLGAGEDVTMELKDAKMKQDSLQEEVNSLKVKLEKAQRAVQQHKEVATAAEESQKQANTANRELSEALEARLKNASEHQTKLEQRITTLEDENRQLNSKKTSLISEVDLRTADLNRQLASLQSELELTSKREKESRKSEQEARDQFAEQMNLVHEAQSKYQREMILHAESVKELMELKEKCTKYDSELENAVNEAQQAKHLLDSNKGMWEKQSNKMAQENDQIKERNEDLSKQITLLHEQVETMSNQMVVLQQKQASSSQPRFSSHFQAKQASISLPEGIEDAKNKSNEQLMDIVKFLRKEKNLCETKFEVAQSEGNRLKQQLSHVQKQLEETKMSLQDERQKSQASSSELSKHESLMKKVETMNVLSDSNRMLRDEKERLQTELQTTKTKLDELKQHMTPLQTENNHFSTQIATLKSEKAMLEQDVQRWQQRSQQLLQSPKRQDPEEYRRLINEKQKLMKNIDQLSKEITEKKLEVSNLQGEIRNSNQQIESQKSENVALTRKVKEVEAEVKAKQTEVEEKNKTIMQIRRVGRRYKTQYEELQKKQHEWEASQKSAEEDQAQDAGISEAVLAESNAKLAALEASLTRTTKEKEDIQKQLELVNAEVEALKSQLQQYNQRNAEESRVSSSEIVEENQKLVNERNEMKKQLLEKEEKSKRLLTMAKTRIEQIRKEKEESISERDRLRVGEEKLKEDMEKLKQDIKAETEQKIELQSKVEDLQRQLTNVSSQQQQQNKVTSVVGHQIHHLAGPSGAMELRKAANIRPISTQRVSQVSPMRVTRTARVMPEPQQESQEGTSSESLPSRSSPHSQAAPSSTHPAASINVSTSSSLPTRAFVHPINPSSSRHQHVVSSMPTSSAIQMPSRSDAHPADQNVVRGSSSGIMENQTQESSVTSIVATSSANITTSEISESDQAIVSSSDDQPTPHEESPQPFAMPSSGTPGQTSVSVTVTESEAAPCQSSSTSSSSRDGVASSGSISVIPIHVSRQGHTSHKRSYDDADDLISGQEEAPASSSDAQVSVAPMSKRQRSSPDQSSAAAQPGTSQTHVGRATSEGGTRVEQAESSVIQPEVKSSSEGEADASVPKSFIQEAQDSQQEMDDAVDTSTFAPISDSAFTYAVVGQSIPASSSTEDVIVLSSDSEGGENNMDQVQDDIYEEDEEGDGMIMEPEDAEGESNLQDLGEQMPLISVRPSLVLHPTPPDYIARSRPPVRPAPLTPGLVPPAVDDGDGIVPCTPTLPTRRHDDNYQTINSPHVPPGGPPIRFRFEDVSVPVQSFQSQGGIGSVDNTLMDFSGAGDEGSRSVPTTPVPAASSVTTVTHSIIEPAQLPSSEVSAVSSSNVEQGDMGEDDKDELDSVEICVPISSSLADEESSLESSTREAAAAGETTSNLQNIRGRRIRLIGGRSRGKGGSSPSTSSQQP